MTPPPPPQTTTCHCGTIRLTFPPLRSPALECLCSICRRYGALWAYYAVNEVTIEGTSELEAYSWGKKRLAFNRCKNCGCMMYYSVLRDSEPQVAVNCRMLEREEFDRLEREESEGDE